MKKAILFVMLACHIPTSPAAAQRQDSFAIYLFAGRVETRSLKRQKWDKLPLAKEPIISEADILAYDFSKHALKLRPEALKRLHSPPVTGTPFVIVVNGERIYPGAFYNSASSIPCDAPVIVVNRIAEGDPAGADVILIERAFPVQFGEGEDPRSDKRVKKTLAKLKKLATL
jgi:hypothetical protein